MRPQYGKAIFTNTNHAETNGRAYETPEKQEDENVDRRRGAPMIFMHEYPRQKRSCKVACPAGVRQKR
jgi:hypothetical protein